MLRRTGRSWVPTSSSSSTSLFPGRLERLGEVMVMVGCRVGISVGSVPPRQGSVLIFTPFIGTVVIASSEPIMGVGWQLCVGVAVSAGRTHGEAARACTLFIRTPVMTLLPDEISFGSASTSRDTPMLPTPFIGTVVVALRSGMGVEQALSIEAPVPAGAP